MVPGTDCTRTRTPLRSTSSRRGTTREALRSNRTSSRLTARRDRRCRVTPTSRCSTPRAPSSRASASTSTTGSAPRPNMAQSYPVVARRSSAFRKRTSSSGARMSRRTRAWHRWVSRRSSRARATTSRSSELSRSATSSRTMLRRKRLTPSWVWTSPTTSAATATTSATQAPRSGPAVRPLQSAEFFRRTADGRPRETPSGSQTSRSAAADRSTSSNTGETATPRRERRSRATGRDSGPVRLPHVMSLSSAIAGSRAMWLPGLGALLLISIFGMLIGLKQHEAPLQRSAAASRRSSLATVTSCGK